MIQNQAFTQAMRCLAHPLSLAAMGLLLVNDHILRVLWPGVLTGKLGDFAWLFFFPFGLAALLALILPARVANNSRLVAVLAFGGTGMVFTLAKTWAPFHAGLVSASSLILGWRVGWRLDPSDLVALPALAGALGLWHSKPFTRIHSLRYTPLLMVAAAGLTVANSIQPETGIICLESEANQITAFSSRGAFYSTSGGMDWQPGAGHSTVSGYLPERCVITNFYASDQQDTLTEMITWTNPEYPAVVYRARRGVAVERSEDGGQTWEVEFELQPDSQALQSYYARRESGNALIADGPFDAAFDSDSGNLVLAMGHSGVLVRLPDGDYQRVGVGRHQPEDPGIGQVLFILFPGEALLALIFGGLGLLLLDLKGQVGLLRVLLGILAAAAWAVVLLAMPPALEGFGYGAIFVMLFLGTSGLILLPMVFEFFLVQGSTGSPALRLSLRAFLVSSLLFFLPHAAWGIDLIPNYRLAQVLGAALGGGWLYFVEWPCRPLVHPQAGVRNRPGWEILLSILLALGAGYFLLWQPELHWPGYLLLVLSLAIIGVRYIRRKATKPEGERRQPAAGGRR